MSSKSFSAFKAKLAADALLRDELSSALGPNGTAESLVEFAKARGFDFEAGEVKSAFEELSDEELDAVAGGTAQLMRACATGKHFKEGLL
jgi:predicted ribosomally synthesized peptide with nif11-like leader